MYSALDEERTIIYDKVISSETHRRYLSLSLFLLFFLETHNDTRRIRRRTDKSDSEFCTGLQRATRPTPAHHQETRRRSGQESQHIHIYIYIYIYITIRYND